MERLVDRFEEIDDPYLRERKADVQQAVERVLKSLMGGQALSPPAISEESSSWSRRSPPADMILFKRHRFAGFVTDVGGVTSHTAIVARSLGIPAIVGLHRARHHYRGRGLDRRRHAGCVDRQSGPAGSRRVPRAPGGAQGGESAWRPVHPAATVDTPIELFANIELPQDMPEVLEAGAEGVGLFRTEFMFLNRKDLPGEEEQFEAYWSLRRR